MAKGFRAPKRLTKKQAADRAKVESALFYDRISWTAARHLLNRTRNDANYQTLSPELRLALEGFLATHPLASSQAMMEQEKADASAG